MSSTPDRPCKRERTDVIPVGLLLIAQDVPPLREPVAEMTLWLERQWVRLRSWRQQRRRAASR